MGNIKSFWSKDKNKLILIAGVIGIIMFLFNLFTPLVADDFSYSFSKDTGEKLTGIVDVFRSQVVHYNTTNGRSVLHFIAQTFLWIGKPIFNIFNTLIYLLFTFLIYFHCNGKRKTNVKLYVFINLVIWFFNPVFGQTMLWLDGSCNYLWGSTIILLFMLPYRLELEKESKKSKWFVPLMFVLGFIAGWCNENTSGAGIFFVLLTIVFLVFQKAKPKFWMWSGLLGSILGFGTMVLSPGNFVRMNNPAFQNDAPLLNRLAAQFVTATNMLLDVGKYLIIIFIILFAIMIYQKRGKKEVRIALMLFITAIACNFALTLSAFYPERAFFGVLTFLIIACGYCLVNITKPVFLKIKTVLLACMASIFILQFIPASYDILGIYINNERREEYIEKQKMQGNLNVETFKIKPKTKYSAFYDLSDVTKDPEHWSNKSIARYYELDSIKS